jgi:large subunit ribosomal protein L9
MSVKIILMEHIEKLGRMGDIVTVKPGYARNFLLPQNKAIRATDSNLAYYNAQKAELQKRNEERKTEATALAAKVKGTKVVILRHASESGQLYGSVSARDVAEALIETSEHAIPRNSVQLNEGLKAIGIYEITVSFHAEVKTTISLNIARTGDEAKIQEKTGQPVLTGPFAVKNQAPAKASKAEETDISAETTEAESDAAA